MPIPAPKEKKTKDEFIAEFMADDFMKKEYPEEKQRLAVAYSQWREKHPEDKDTKKNSKTGYSKTFQSKFLQSGLVSYENEGQGIGFLSKEEIEKGLDTFIGCPLIIEHNDDVNPENVEDVIKHECGRIARAWYDAETEYFWCEGVCYDSEAEDKILNAKWKVSCAFSCDYPKSKGEWHGLKYTNLIQNLKFNHLAIVENPRYEIATIEFIEPKQLVNENKRVLFNSKNLKNIQEDIVMGKGQDEKNFFDYCKKFFVNDKKTNDEDELKKDEKKNEDGKMIEIDGKEVSIDELIKTWKAEQKEKGYMTENKKKNKKNDDDDDDVKDKVLMNEEEEEDEEDKKNENKCSCKKNKKVKNEDEEDKENDEDEDKKELKNSNQNKRNELDRVMNNSKKINDGVQYEVITPLEDSKRAREYYTKGRK